MKIIDLILEHYPKAENCINGHVGESVETVEEELADDRYYRVRVKRCSHCNMPMSGGEYV